jgi:hypothetical protein
MVIGWAPSAMAAPVGAPKPAPAPPAPKPAPAPPAPKPAPAPPAPKPAPAPPADDQKAQDQKAQDQKAQDQAAAKAQQDADKKAADQAAKDAKDAKAQQDAADKAAKQQQEADKKAAEQAKKNPQQTPPSDTGNGDGSGTTSNSGQDAGPPAGQTDQTGNGNGNGAGNSNGGVGNGNGNGNVADSNPGHGGTPPGQTDNSNSNGNGNGGVGHGNGNGNVPGSNPGHGGTPPGQTAGQPGNGNHGAGNNGNAVGHQHGPVTSVVFTGSTPGPVTGPENWLPFGSATSASSSTQSPLSVLFLGAAGSLASSGTVVDGQTHVLGEKFEAGSPTQQLSASAMLKAFDKKSKARAPRMKAQPSEFTGSALTSGSWHNTGSAIPLLALLLLAEILILARRFGNKVRPARTAGVATSMPAQVRWA